MYATGNENTFRTRAPLAWWILLLFVSLIRFYVIYFLFVIRPLNPYCAECSSISTLLSSTYGQRTGPKCTVEGYLYTCKLDVRSAGMPTQTVYSRIPLVPDYAETEGASFWKHKHWAVVFTFALSVLYKTSYKLHTTDITVCWHWGWRCWGLQFIYNSTELFVCTFMELCVSWKHFYIR